MLKKLFTYDFRCISRLSAPCLLGMVGSTLLSLLFFWIMWSTRFVSSFGFFSVLCTMALIACFLLLLLFAAAPAFINYYHFAKILYFDEGYLTMTLPASEHEILLGKILVGFLWLIIDIVVALISIFGLIAGILLITLYPFNIPDSDPEISLFFGDVVAAFFGHILYILLYVLFEVVLGMTVITFGCLIVPKHKILGILLFYILLNWAVGLINQMISLFLSEAFLAAGSMDALGVTMPLVLSGALVPVILLCYFLTHRMLKKKINLE